MPPSPPSLPAQETLLHHALWPEVGWVSQRSPSSTELPGAVSLQLPIRSPWAVLLAPFGVRPQLCRAAGTEPQLTPCAAACCSDSTAPQLQAHLAAPAPPCSSAGIHHPYSQLYFQASLLNWNASTRERGSEWKHTAPSRGQDSYSSTLESPGVKWG